MKTREALIIAGKVSAAGLLFAAMGQRRYGYYVYLRWLICGLAGAAAYHSFSQRRHVWGALLGCVGILFNPIFPFHIGRDNWVIVDAVSGLLLLSSTLVHRTRRRLQQPMGSSTTAFGGSTSEGKTTTLDATPRREV